MAKEEVLVICINNGPLPPRDLPAPQLVEGNVYTVISEYYTKIHGYMAYILKEVSTGFIWEVDKNEIGFHAERFIKIGDLDEAANNYSRVLTEVHI